MKVKVYLFLSLALFAFARPLWAHPIPLSYSEIHLTRTQLVYDLYLQTPDVRRVISFFAPPDRPLTQADLDSRREVIRNYVEERILLRLDGVPWNPHLQSMTLLGQRAHTHLPEPQVRLTFVQKNLSGLPLTFTLRLKLYEELSSLHQGYIAIVLPHKTLSFLLQGSALRNISIGAPPLSLGHKVLSFLGWGIMHILSGYDHIAFLIGLLIAAYSFRNILVIATGFTLAHSLTLCLAALHLVSFPSRWVEILIAFSIFFVAVENIVLSRGHSYRWLVAFGFGLVHGLGFSSLLQELLVGRHYLLLYIVSFNLGVEIGQILIIAAVLPWFLWMRRKRPRLYRVAIHYGLSILIAALGLTWMLDRFFLISLLPF